MQFISQRIDEINEYRHEAVKHAVGRKQVEAIDARVFELRKDIRTSY